MTGVFELGTDGPSRILVGVDGTETSLRAGAYAAGMARRGGAQLLVVYVTTTPAAAAAAPETVAATLAGQRQVASELQELVAQEAPRLGVRAEFLLRHGNPYKELLDVAAQRRVDAIVVGASMQAGHRFVGSLAGRLVRDAAWPVTVVP
jgi:nucleotide-binding universal stress UspA family protein